MMGKDVFKETLNCGLDRLYEKDQYLICNRLDNHGSELSITHKLGTYLESLFQEYDVDCEYNRNEENIKRRKAGRPIRPDIIIHKRGDNENNFIVIEVKTWWNKNTRKDKTKLYEMTDKNGVFRYQYGISLIIEKARDKVEIIVFSNGKKV